MHTPNIIHLQQQLQPCKIRRSGTGSRSDRPVASCPFEVVGNRRRPIRRVGRLPPPSGMCVPVADHGVVQTSRR